MPNNQDKTNLSNQAASPESETILETALDGFIIANKKGKFLAVNDAYCKISGYKREELLKMNILELEAIETGEETRRHVEEMMEKGKGRFETKHKRKDGTLVNVEASINYSNMEGGRFYAFFRDITERKQIEDELKESETRYRTVIETANDQIFTIDADLKILSMNSFAAEIFHKKPEELVGKSLSEIFPEEIASSTSKNVRKVFETGTNLKIEESMIFGDRKIWNSTSLSPLKDYEGKVIAVIGIARDITESKISEEALHRNAEEITDIYNNAPCGYHSIDKNGFFVRINNTELSWLGYSADELIGKKRVTDILTPESVETFKVNFPKLMSTGKLKDIEIEFVRKDGKVLPILLSATTVNDSSGNFLMSRSTLYDITGIRRISEEKRQASEKLVELISKLEKRSKQNLILSEMREMLQACTTVSEIPQIVRGSMQKLFPYAEGALFILSPSRSDLESVARWNNFPEDIDDNVFSPDACWSLRLGRVHLIEDLNIGPVCGHIKNLQTTAYVCIPLVAKGDILGTLHLRTVLDRSSADQNKTCEDFKELSATISEYLSLSIANIRLSEKLAYESIRDPLTGLFNRRYMEETLRREILRAERKKTQINILMGDIDHFKLFNDRYGHAAGDTLLAHVGEFLRNNIRGGDVACRYGGEEFILFLPESSLEDSIKRAEQMLKDIKKLEVKYVGETLAPISFSFGISTYPDSGSSAENLLRKADEALYRAKQQGRDRVVISS
jgi:diguanylate cyclase (GGDEF)-like protein/PAS domain S-box-containing protein